MKSFQLSLFLFVLLNLSSSSVLSQTSKSQDSVQAWQHTVILNAELARLLTDSTHIIQEIDSLLTIKNFDSLDELVSQRLYNLLFPMYWTGGHVHYAPDSTFKVFSIEGNSGGSSKSMYHSFMHIGDSTVLNMTDEFSIIDTILKIGNSNYAIIDYSYPGYIMGSMAYSFSCFTLNADSLKPLVIDTSEYNELDKWGRTGEGGFSISSLHGLEDFTYMEYNPTENVVSFQYAIYSELTSLYKIPEKYLPLQENEVLIVKGEIDLAHGLPKLQSQSFKKIKWEP